MTLTAPARQTANRIYQQARARGSSPTAALDEVQGQIGTYLQSKGSPLAPYAPAFVAAGRKYGVDPKLLVSIAGAESSFGKNNFLPNNAFGYGKKTFKDYPQAIDTVASDLGRNYIGKGLRTLPQIGQRYSPPNINPNWLPNVSSFYGQLGGTSPAASTATTAPLRVAAPAAPAATSWVTALRAKPAAATAAPGGSWVQALRTPQPAQPAAAASWVDALSGRPAQPAAQPKLKVQVTHGDPVSPLAAPVIAEARKWIGTPYSWGGGGPAGPSYGTGRGASTKGFDCSSFAQYLAAKQGVQIPRTTYDQWAKLPSVQGVPQPGDLVFFEPSQRGPGHVGLALGDGQFIESPHTGATIRISKLAGRTDYVGARRIA